MQSTFYSSTIAKLVVGLALPMLIVGCDRQSPVNPPDPVTIERIDIEGIPTQNIKLDQASKEITIQVPATVTKLTLPVSYTLGCADCSLQGGKQGKTQLYLFSPPPAWSISQTGKEQAVNYRIVLQPTGQLTAGQNPNPIQYQAENRRFALTILNYYDGESAGEITFRNVATGVTTTTSEVYNLADSVNRFVVTIYAGLPLGNYTIELSKKNGRQVRLPQVLQVKKGPLSFFAPRFLLANAPRITLTGFNLYSDDNLEVLLKNSHGDVINLTPIAYKADGTGLEVSTPPDLKTGYYTVQLTQHGQELPPVPYGNLMVVTENSQQPFLYGIYPEGVFTAGPLTLERGKKYSVGLSVNSSVDTQVALKLVSTTTPATEYLTPVAVPTNFFLGFTEGTGVSVTIPGEVLPGRYTVYPRFQRSSGVLEGLLYGWEVDVK